MPAPTTVPPSRDHHHPVRHPLEVLTEADCLHLLASEQVGRLGVVHHGRPEIFPVNYALDVSGAIVFRSEEGTKLAAALNRPVVFEVDRIDGTTHTGWSVMVHGVAHHTSAVADGPSRLTGWVEEGGYLVRISRRSITGRRLTGA